MKKVKYSVLVRYYNYVCKKLHKARNEMNEDEIMKWKIEKMKYLFTDSQIAKEYAKQGIETMI